MTESASENEPGGIGDEDLPEDLQPNEDNPLAEPLDSEVDPDDLDLAGGKDAEQGGDEPDAPGDADGTGSGASDSGGDQD